MVLNFGQVAQEEAKFNTAFGAAMVKWGIIEQRLCFWFIFLTQMPEAMARAMFYDGVTSFTPRLRLLSIATEHTPVTISSELRKCLKTISIKSGLYYSTRNALAHCETKYDFVEGSPTYGQLYFVEGADPQHQMTPAITMNDLPVITQNFQELARLIMDAYQHWNEEASLQTIREQVHRLPISARDTTPNSKPIKDEPLPQS